MHLILTSELGITLLVENDDIRGMQHKIIAHKHANSKLLREAWSVVSEFGH